MMTMLDLFPPSYPFNFFLVCLNFFFIFCVLALLALLASFILSSVCNVAIPVGVISMWNEKRQSSSARARSDVMVVFELQSFPVGL